MKTGQVGLLGVSFLLGFVGACKDEPKAPLQLAEGATVRVVKAVKGDELVVTAGGQEARVRLLGIQAFSAVIDDPQVQALAAGGIAAVEKLARDKEVQLSFDTPEKDSSGRYLAYVSVSGTDLNKQLIEQGWAVVYTEFSFMREAAYLAAEAMARQAGRNIWGFEPAVALVKGLRRQWGEVRKGKPLADPLVAAVLPSTP